MKFRGLTALSLLLAVPAVSAGAQDVFSHPVDNGTRPEVLAIAARLASRPVIKAAFRQTKEVIRLSRSFISTGRMIFDVARGLVWEVTVPVTSATVMTKDRITQRNSQGKISVLSLAGNDTFRRFSTTLQAVFSGDFTQLEQEFEIFYIRKTAGHWAIGLTPKDRTIGNVISGIEIRGGNDLDRFILHEANGDRVVYSFQDFVYPKGLSPDDEKAFF